MIHVAQRFSSERIANLHLSTLSVLFSCSPVLGVDNDTILLAPHQVILILYFYKSLIILDTKTRLKNKQNKTHISILDGIQRSTLVTYVNTRSKSL